MRTALKCAAMLALMTPAAAAAETIVDTGTPSGDILSSLSPTQNLAGYFSVNSAVTISRVEGFILDYSAADSLTVTLFSDGATPAADNALFSITFFSTAGESWKGVSGLGWAIRPGGYWLAFSADSHMAMRDGAPSPLGAYAYTSQGIWNRYDQLGIGFRVFGDVGGAIPEPGAWALLLLGFGAIGAGMRARRGAVTLRFAG